MKQLNEILKIFYKHIDFLLENVRRVCMCNILTYIMHNGLWKCFTFVNVCLQLKENRKFFC